MEAFQLINHNSQLHCPKQKLIYSGKNSWNGTNRGRLVRQGWYIYYIQAKLKDGTTYQKRDRFYLKH